MYPEIDTERLVLRQFRHSDIDAVAHFMADEETMRYIGGACGREDAWRRMAVSAGHWVLRGFGPWAVEEKSTGHFIGRVGMWYPESWPGPEAIWGLVPAKRGRGFATEAARATIDFAFETLDMARVCSLIHPDNTASIRVAERLGQHFSHEMERNHHPCLVYVIDRDTR